MLHVYVWGTQTWIGVKLSPLQRWSQIATPLALYRHGQNTQQLLIFKQQRNNFLPLLWQLRTTTSSLLTALNNSSHTLWEKERGRFCYYWGSLHSGKSNKNNPVYPWETEVGTAAGSRQGGKTLRYGGRGGKKPTQRTSSCCRIELKGSIRYTLADLESSLFIASWEDVFRISKCFDIFGINLFTTWVNRKGVCGSTIGALGEEAAVRLGTADAFPFSKTGGIS